MKKLFATTAIAIFGLAGAALADTVGITSETSFSTPSGNVSSDSVKAFVGPETIIFSVAGKTCTLNGSARGSVPMGCNYHITVDPNGNITGALTAGNSVCTQSGAVAAQCK